MKKLYTINESPKRSAGKRPRSIDAIRLEIKRDADLLSRFGSLLSSHHGRFYFKKDLDKLTDHSTDQLEAELKRLYSRASSRESEIYQDHQITNPTENSICKSNNNILNGLIQIAKDLCKSDKEDRRPHLILNSPKTIRIDRAGRKARRTCPELILEAIEIAESYISGSEPSDWEDYLFTLRTICRMSRDNEMLKIRLLEVQEAVAEIPVAEHELDRQANRVQCFKAADKHLLGKLCRG